MKNIHDSFMHGTKSMAHVCSCLQIKEQPVALRVSSSFEQAYTNSPLIQYSIVHGLLGGKIITSLY